MGRLTFLLALLALFVVLRRLALLLLSVLPTSPAASSPHAGALSQLDLFRFPAEKGSR